MTLPEKTRLLARSWHDKAAGDLRAAVALGDSQDVPAWIVGFHLQQSLEKAWKGRLVLDGVRPAPVHDLRALLEARPDLDELDPGDAKLIQHLQVFAVQERYPLLVPREADRAALLALIPDVQRHVDALDAELR